MDYPIEILPQKGRVLLRPEGKAFLLRHIEEKGWWDHEVDLIKDSAVCNPSSNMIDLSTSLKDVFCLDHIGIEIIDKSLSGSCAPDESVDIPVFKKGFDWIENRGYWMIQIMNLNGKTQEFNRFNETFTARCVIRHTPAKWNYFHFSVNWYIEELKMFWHDMDESDKKKDWSKKRLSSFTRQLLRINIKKEHFQ